VSLGITSEEAAIRMSMALGGCPHEKPIPVDTLDGEVVAALCTDCDAQLPPGFGCEDCTYAEVSTFGQQGHTRILDEPCRAHRR
jgi:hypothetical protein